MDIHQAYQILKADPNDTDSSLSARYEIQHNQLKSKIDLAPNEVLKEKFSTTLQDIEIAYAKVLRHRSGKDEVDTNQLPITNTHTNNSKYNNEKEEDSPSKTLKKEVEKLTKNFKYAFFACVLFLATTVYFMLENNKKEANYLELEKKNIELAKMADYHNVYKSSKNLTIKNSDKDQLTINYLKIWYIDERGKPELKSIEFFNKVLDAGQEFKPNIIENNSKIYIENWIFLYTTIEVGPIKFGQGLHCSEVKNGIWLLETK